MNASSASARIVFDKQGTRRVHCPRASAQTGRRGQYLVRPGETLTCSLEGGSAHYSV